MNIAIASKEFVVKKMVEIGAHPLKKWGQNFLIDETMSKDLVSALKIEKNDRVLEIGPGLGALSEHLAASNGKVTLLDIDPLFCEHLRKTFATYPNLEVVQGDVMKYDLSPFNKVIGNLPYYLTTPILEKTLEHASHLSCFVGMVQKEVFPRVIAKLGDEEYGPLSILYSYVGQISIVRKVSKVNFIPVPHVDSLVFKVDFRKDLDPVFLKKLTSVTKNLFLLRRKTILNNLGGLVGGKEKALDLLGKLNIEPQKRPEELPLSFYVSLTELLRAEKVSV